MLLHFKDNTNKKIILIHTRIVVIRVLLVSYEGACLIIYKDNTRPYHVTHPQVE